ncbi:MAG: HAD-IB family phosphatase [Proteobacteria bacterium]|nr:HAD-IB family phosphatase [Pseudomonadota bacterium]
MAALTGRFLDRRLAGLIRPAARAVLERHRAAGDRLVLLSASTDFYVDELGRRLGFDEVICTGVAFRGDRLDGALTTPNRRGTEKARCLEGLRARFPGATICAYGNADSDLEHLCAADRATVVNGSRRLERRARALGLAVEQWR